ncbi:MAG: DUF1735 domain-containing protein [Bacteroides sp.]
MNKIYILVALLMLSTLIIGCDSVDSWKNTIPGVVSVGTTGAITLETRYTSEPMSQEIAVVKGGLEDINTTIRFSVEKAMLDSMNHIDGTTYELLPESCYLFTQNTVSLNVGVRSGKAVFQYDPAKIEALCGYNTIIYVLPLVAQSEGLPLNKERRIVLYKFKILQPDIRTN